VLQLSCEATGADIVPSEVIFTYPQPSSTIAHRGYFRCPIRFGAPTASIVFLASDLNRPLVRADETLAGYLGNYAEQVLESLVQGETARHMVNSAIWSLLGDGIPSLEQVATVLSVPPRTLQRRLAAEGTSLAFLLGFAEPSTFFRSFKRWTATTPRRFRIAAE
jgi:AraC-like DNA-binding protein